MKNRFEKLKKIFMMILIFIMISSLLDIIFTVSHEDEIYVNKDLDTYTIMIKGSNDVIIILEFNNSVTREIVRLVFEKHGEYIYGKYFYTDEKTIEYYSSGFIKDLNVSIESYKDKNIIMCTESGLYIKIYNKIICLPILQWYIKNGCVMIFAE
jgi:hypothetical protein